MPTVEQLKRAASDYRKAKKYQQALPPYRTLWEQHRNQCNEWDGWGYAFCLRKLGQARAALDVCREVYRLHPEFEPNRNEYGWCIYDLVIKRSDEQIAENPDEFFTAVGKILEITQPGQFSPYVRTVLKAVDFLDGRPAYPAEKILEWTSRLKPPDLSSEEGKGTDSKTGRAVTFASDREKWYAFRSKALLELGRYEECIKLCQEALAAFPVHHHDNDIWFKRRIALSKAGLGDKAGAITDLQSLLARKRDFYIYHEIAQYQFDLGQVDAALQNAVAGALAPGDLPFKWKLFLMLGRILQARSENNLAARHVELAVKVMVEQNWKVPDELNQAASEMNVVVSGGQSSHEIALELRKFWQGQRVADLRPMTGKITNVLPNGKSAFIRGDDGKDYYFRTNAFKGPRHLLAQGQPVSFFVEPGPDANKADTAVEVTPAASGK